MGGNYVNICMVNLYFNIRLLYIDQPSDVSIID